MKLFIFFAFSVIAALSAAFGPLLFEASPTTSQLAFMTNPGDAARAQRASAASASIFPQAVHTKDGVRVERREQMVAALAGADEPAPAEVATKGAAAAGDEAELRKFVAGVEHQALEAAGKAGFGHKPQLDYKANTEARPVLTGGNAAAVASRPAISAAPDQKPAAAAQEQKLSLLDDKQRQKLGELVDNRKLPAIDATIEFEYNSAALTQKAIPLLTQLGEALNDGRLKGATFVIAGHTDAVGSPRFNNALSLQRAHTVRDFLKEKFRIEDEHLVAVGYGEGRLKNRANPKADENRRVEFVKLVR